MRRYFSDTYVTGKGELKLVASFVLNDAFIFSTYTEAWLFCQLANHYHTFDFKVDPDTHIVYTDEAV